LRITLKPDDSELHCLLATATICRNQFTPMSYLKYTARSFQRSLGNLEVEKDQGITAAQILDDINVKLIPMAADLGGAQTRTMDQIQEGKNRVNSFVQAHRDSSVTHGVFRWSGGGRRAGNGQLCSGSLANWSRK